MDIKKLLIIDIVVLAIYALSANPSITGLALHEWIGLGVLLVLVVHTAMHFDWIADTLRYAASRRGIRLVKLIVDMLLVIALVVCAVSGIMVSGVVLPLFDMFATGYYFWNPLHAFSAKVLLALVLVHVVFNWKIIVTALRKKGSNDD